jgi:hypothetical protein
MDKFKGTPGKWIVSNRSSKNQFGVKEYLIDNDRTTLGLASVYAPLFGQQTEDEEYLANAKLIAAAPELLEALAYLINCNEVMRFKSELPNALEKAKEVYNKALGL